MTESILAKDKDIVVPGQKLAEGMGYLPGYGAFRHKEDVYASRLGLAQIDGRAVRIIPLSGRYNPKKGDTIIAHVIDISISGWRLETNSAYSAMLSIAEASSQYIQRGADLTKYFNLGDYVVAKISNVTSQKLVDLTMKAPGLQKLTDGRAISVNPNKVPRIIGRGGSMVSLIKDATKCQITVGQNGIVWISGDAKMELLAEKAIKMVEEKAHVPGLTEKMKVFLSKVK